MGCRICQRRGVGLDATEMGGQIGGRVDCRNGGRAGGRAEMVSKRKW